MSTSLVSAWVAFAMLQTVFRQADQSRLARRFCARDPKVMGDLYDLYGGHVYSLIFRVVHDSAAAEDLTQETFLRIWSRSSAFDEKRDALGPWIMTVARNRAIEYLRAAAARKHGGPLLSASDPGLDLNHSEHPAQFRDFDQDALGVERAQKLKQAFAELTSSQKSVMELAYYEGLPVASIAKRVQQPEGTVKTWLRAALQQLREQLAGTAAE